MEKEGGIPLQNIYADGGAVRNQFLMQFVADLSGKSVYASQLPELSALGAMFSGGLGMKVYDTLKDLEAIPMGFSRYDPNLEPEQVERLTAGWRHAVRQVLAE